MSDVFYGQLQTWERMDRIAKSMLVRGGASLLAMAIVVMLTGSVAWGSLGVFLAWLTVFVMYDMRSPMQGSESFSIRGELGRAWHWGEWRSLLPLAWLALPLGIVQMLISLHANVPRLLVQGFSGEHDLGIFAAIASVTIAGSTFVTAVGQAVSPRLAHQFASGDRAGFVRLLQQLTVLFMAGCALGLAIVLLAGNILLTVLYTPEYAEHSFLLLIFTLCLGAGTIVSVFGFGITAARRFRSQVPVVVLAVMVVTVSGFVFVPRLGIAGAAWAVLLSLSIWAIGSGLLLRSVLAELPKPSARTDIVPVTVGAAGV